MDRLVWIDLETTGLDPDVDQVLAVGCIVTDGELVELYKLEQHVWQPDEVLDRMIPRVREMHERSGLVGRVRSSTLALAEVESEVMRLLARATDRKKAFLAGSSVHFDRAFMARHMPSVIDWLHYRQLDVSSWKLGVRLWGGDEWKPGGKTMHTPIADLRNSLAEARHYRAQLGVK